MDESIPRTSPEIELTAFRIVQEAVNNVVQHAQASRCTVTLAIDQGLKLVVEDDGVGVGVTAVSGVGLISMKERAAELGGSCTLQCLPDGGTRVEALLPLSAKERP